MSFLSHMDDLLLESEIQRPARSSLRFIASCKQPLRYKSSQGSFVLGFSLGSLVVSSVAGSSLIFSVIELSVVFQ